MELIKTSNLNKMKTLKSIIISILAITTFFSCSDIVEVDDVLAKKYPDSKGLPEINRIVLATDTLTEITGANFEDMIRLNGSNLGCVTSVKFNDVEVSKKDFYSTYNLLVVPVPRILPKEVTNKIYISSPYGTLEIPFEVSIPQLKIIGLYNEFAAPGDTTTIEGDNFDLYGITVEEATLTLGNSPVMVLTADRSSLTIQIPMNAPSNSEISIKGSNMSTTINIPYKQYGVSQLFDFNNWPGYGAFTHSSKYPNATPNFLCTGNEGPDFPEPIDEGTKYIRFNGTVGAWGWMVFWAGYISVPSAVAANPSAYDLRFEVLTNSKYPISTATRFILGDYIWYPATNGLPLNTYGKWKTIRISADTPNLLPSVIDPNSLTPFKLIISPESEQTLDISMCNFRFIAK